VGEKDQFVAGEIDGDTIVGGAQHHLVQLVPQMLSRRLLFVRDELVLGAGDLLQKGQFPVIEEEQFPGDGGGQGESLFG